MDYYKVREKFCELCGRYDLINADLTDNGADYFLNSAQKYLDRSQNTGKMVGKNVQLVSAGSIKVYVEGLRSVKEVWAGTSVDGLIRLNKAPNLDYLRSLYGKQLSDIDASTPEWYAPAIFRPIPDTSDTTSLSGYYDVDDLLLSTEPIYFKYSGIIITPPPSTDYYISIYGTFYSPTLSATLSDGEWTQTKSMWTEVFPDTLISAALYKLEAFYRNSEGRKDRREPLIEDLIEMDKDAAEEEMADINQMGG